MEITLSLILALVIVFAILFGIYWATGYFGSPMGQKIVGVICLIVFAVYALKRLGLLDVGAIQL